MGESPAGPHPHNHPTIAPAEQRRPSLAVGPYRLRELLGEGGMGEVWLADQIRPVQRQVALKVIKAGMDTARVVARFEAERQALALMSHPSIAQVFDAGATPEGRPFFAMEYVSGEPITTYCQRHRLTTRERIRLFLDVCDAVQHAHQKGIIHRDLKPTNVLVTVRDGRAVPKVIDFGVAKATTTQSLTERTLHTERGMLIGTLEYMSPEQAEMSGLDVDTRTDVYALGVILYELLTGSLPFEPKELRKKPLDEIRRTIREVDPPRPSTRVTTASGETPAGGKAAAGAIALAHELRGDLDWITLRALEKDRTRRYGSASDLAADLQRHLDNLPVLACPPSLSYRVGKFGRRHRWLVTAAATILILVLGFAVTTFVQARQVALERDRAQTAQATAEQVSAFLVRLFEASDPSESLGDTITARQLLARGVERADQLNEQPEVQSRLLDLMGRVYQSLGQYDAAQPLIERSLAVRRAAFGEAHPTVAESLTHLGELSTLRGRFDLAETQLRDALARHERLAGRESAEAAMDLHLLGAVLVDRGRVDEGRALIQEGLEIRRRVLPAGHLDLPESMSGLAYAASNAGDYVEMERWHREALTLLRQSLGDRHPRIALALNNLAAAVDARGRYDEAAALHTEALALRRQIYGEDHPAVATSLNNLANVLQKQERYAEAEPLARQVVEMRKRLLGAEHPSTGVALNNLGVLLFRAGRPADALPVMEEARAVAVARFGEAHPRVSRTDAILASIAADLGRDADAEALFTRSVATLERSQADDDLDLASGRLAFGRFLRERRRYAEAEPLLTSAFDVRKARLGEAHPDTARAVTELAALYRATGNSEKAATLTGAARQ